MLCERSNEREREREEDKEKTKKKRSRVEGRIGEMRLAKCEQMRVAGPQTGGRKNRRRQRRKAQSCVGDQGIGRERGGYGQRQTAFQGAGRGRRAIEDTKGGSLDGIEGIARRRSLGGEQGVSGRRRRGGQKQGVREGRSDEEEEEERRKKKKKWCERTKTKKVDDADNVEMPSARRCCCRM